jgi:alkylation response protein AidB-like acyl-CoA dehydrogenase
LRKVANERASLLTPIAKAFSTDIGIEVASLGVQVHGGMGFIEETGAASIIATHASPLSTKAPTASSAGSTRRSRPPWSIRRSRRSASR